MRKILHGTAIAAIVVGLASGCSSSPTGSATTSSAATPSPSGTIDPEVPLEEQVQGAITHGDIALLRALLDAGVSPDTVMVGGGRPVDVAVIAGRLDMVELLIERGANLDATDGADRTPIMYAAVSAGPEIVDAILDAGADPYYASYGYPGYVAAHLAAQNGNVDALRSLAAHGVDLDARSESQSTALTVASQFDQAEAVEYLVGLGDSIDLDARDDSGTTALGWARANENEDIAALLEAAGASE